MKNKRPTPKEFDIGDYQEKLTDLNENMSELKFERQSEVLVPYILKDYEGFETIEKGPDFRGTPFDFFGFKEGSYYLVEYKGSLNSFNSPGETQKRRLQEILSQFENLGVVLLQVKINKAQYRIFYNEELDLLFQGQKAPLEPIIDWLGKRLA